MMNAAAHVKNFRTRTVMPHSSSAARAHRERAAIARDFDGIGLDGDLGSARHARHGTVSPVRVRPSGAPTGTPGPRPGELSQ